MKDSYTFDIDAAGLDAGLRQALRGILRDFRSLRAELHDGGSAFRRDGRHAIARVHGGFRRRRRLRGAVPRLQLRGELEKAVSRPIGARRSPIPRAISRRSSSIRPARKTIAEVSEFTNLPESSQMKSLVMVADGKPVLALLRGDHRLSETKFAPR